MKLGMCVYHMKMKVKFDFGGNGRIMSTAAGLCHLFGDWTLVSGLCLLKEASDRNETWYVCLSCENEGQVRFWR